MAVDGFEHKVVAVGEDDAATLRRWWRGAKAPGSRIDRHAQRDTPAGRPGKLSAWHASGGTGRRGSLCAGMPFCHSSYSSSAGGGSFPGGVSRPGEADGREASAFAGIAVLADLASRFPSYPRLTRLRLSARNLSHALGDRRGSPSSFPASTGMETACGVTFRMWQSKWSRGCPRMKSAVGRMSGAMARASAVETPAAILIAVLAANEARSDGAHWSRCWCANTHPACTCASR